MIRAAVRQRLTPDDRGKARAPGRTLRYRRRRCTVLELTEDGIRLRDRVRSQHRQAFVQITRDWPERKRLEFARLLIEYADACAELTNRPNQHSEPG